jgi:hypothetical protein
VRLLGISPADGTFAMSTFSYSPADPTKSKSIRLLSILPGGTEGPLCCRLNEYASDSENDLYNSVCYEALSYTWGDDSENQKREITLNGCPFAVTANLYAALQVLRKEDRERVIWVDAVCINQNDIEDKERQVSSELFHDRLSEHFVRFVTCTSYTRKLQEFLHGWV